MVTPKKREPSDTPSRFARILPLILVTGSILVAYSNTFNVPFHFDDMPNIVYNPNIQFESLKWENIARLVRNTYRNTIRVFSYFTLALNYFVGQEDVFGYHVVNIIIHILSGIFLYQFLMLTFDLPPLKQRYGITGRKIALLTTLIFVTHPIQTQSVTYIVQRMASMAGMFYILAMLLYVKGRLTSVGSRWAYFGASVLSYITGVFSKENVAILPVFVALYELYFFQNFDFSPKGRKVLFALAGALFMLVFAILAVWGKRFILEMTEGYRMRTFTLTERLLTQARVVLYYLSLLVYPHPSRLNLDYDFPTSRTILDPPTTLLSIVAITALVVFSVLMAKKRPLLSYCILWYFGNLLIESSIFPLEMVYEHRLYLPSVGPFILFSLCFFKGLQVLGILKEPAVRTKSKQMTSGIPMGWQRVEVLTASVLIALLLIGTYVRNRVWNSQIALQMDCAKKSPNKPRVYTNLGNAYLAAGIYDKAIESCEKAIRLNPKEAYAYYNLCLVYQNLEQYDKAIAMAKKALEEDPNLDMAYYALGGLYFKKGMYEEAERAYKRFLEIYPYFPNIHHLLGVIYAVERKFDKAITEFETEVRINPKNSLAHLNLGQIYWHEFKNRNKALHHLRLALMLDPLLPEARAVRGLVRMLEAGS